MWMRFYASLHRAAPAVCQEDWSFSLSSDPRHKPVVADMTPLPWEDVATTTPRATTTTTSAVTSSQNGGAQQWLQGPTQVPSQNRSDNQPPAFGSNLTVNPEFGDTETSTTKELYALIAAVVVVVTMLFVLCLVYLLKRWGKINKVNSEKEDTGDLSSIGDPQPSELPLEDQSALVSTSIHTADFFKDNHMQEILCQGLAEHWFIESFDISIQSIVAKGGFGEVMKGMLYGLTPVAIKKPRQKEGVVQTNDEAIALANEMRMFRMLRHPNIVFFHGSTVYAVEGHMIMCLVLEWVEGCHLGIYVRRDHDDLDRKLGASTEDYRIKLLADVARGMQYLHAQEPSVLHRDLKPANILVETIADPPRAKIADFGLSIIGEAIGKAGTRGYMAPEVLRYGSKYGCEADVYSYGCICLYVLTKKNFDGGDKQQLLLSLVPDLARGMRKVAQMGVECLNQDPLQRPIFEDMSQMFQSQGETTPSGTGTGGNNSASRSASIANSDKSTSSGL